MGSAAPADDSQLVVSLNEYGAILTHLFHKIDYRLPKPYYNPEIEPALAKYVEEQPWSDNLKARSVKYAKQAIGIASWYPRASFACQFNCVIITLLVIIYDEEYASFGTTGTEFSTKLVRGQPQKAPFLDSLAHFLQNTNRYLGPYGSSMVIKTTIEFVEGTNVENDFNEFVPIDALRFPRYLRIKTGFAETYAHAIFPNDTFPEDQYRKLYLPALPVLCDIIDFTNDILSFYKETIRGTERINYICNVAKSTGRSALQCLYDTSDAIENRVAEMRRILKPHPALLAHANDYLAAYIGWHICTTSRYHLDEVKIIVGVDVADLVGMGGSAAVLPLGAMTGSDSAVAGVQGKVLPNGATKAAGEFGVGGASAGEFGVGEASAAEFVIGGVSTSEFAIGGGGLAVTNEYVEPGVA